MKSDCWWKNRRAKYAMNRCSKSGEMHADAGKTVAQMWCQDMDRAHFGEGCRHLVLFCFFFFAFSLCDSGDACFNVKMKTEIKKKSRCDEALEPPWRRADCYLSPISKHSNSPGLGPFTTKLLLTPSGATNSDGDGVPCFVCFFVCHCFTSPPTHCTFNIHLTHMNERTFLPLQSPPPSPPNIRLLYSGMFLKGKTPSLPPSLHPSLRRSPSPPPPPAPLFPLHPRIPLVPRLSLSLSHQISF